MTKHKNKQNYETIVRSLVDDYLSRTQNDLESKKGKIVQSLIDSKLTGTEVFVGEQLKAEFEHKNELVEHVIKSLKSRFGNIPISEFKHKLLEIIENEYKKILSTAYGQAMQANLAQPNRLGNFERMVAKETKKAKQKVEIECTISEQQKTSSSEPKRIFGESWTVFGIPIHIRNLLYRVRKLKPWIRRISYLGLIIVILLVNAFYTRSFWLPLIGKLASDSDEIEEGSVESKLPLSLKEICQDIDNRPLVQKEETAKRYVGIRIEKELLELFEVIPYDESGEFNLLLLFPGEPYQVGPVGWKISLTVDKDSYPWLGAAKRGLRLIVSGRIGEASTTVIGLCDVSLEIDTKP